MMHTPRIQSAALAAFEHPEVAPCVCGVCVCVCVCVYVSTGDLGQSPCLPHPSSHSHKAPNNHKAGRAPY